MTTDRPLPENHTVEKAATVLLLVDVINDFDFPRGRDLLRHGLPVARKIAALKKRLHRRKVPVVYVNDNFGRWRSDFRAQVDRCIQDACPGSAVARLLIPEPDDYFVLKPKHSGFYSTALELLLSDFGAKRLIITGFAADICVLFTANDAYMRGYEILVPRNCVASETAGAKTQALLQMRRFLRADTRPAALIRNV